MEQYAAAKTSVYSDQFYDDYSTDKRLAAHMILYAAVDTISLQDLLAGRTNKNSFNAAMSI